MRYYDVDGTLCVSVTTALGIIRRPFLERWRGNIGNLAADSIMEEAGDLGSRAHRYAEAINRGEEMATPRGEDMALMVHAYQGWFDENVSEVVCVERVVADLKYCYAGRLDLCARIKGDRLPSIIDIKTGGVWPDAYLQLAAYQKALPVETGRRLIVHIDKKNPGKLAVQEAANNLDTDYRMFLYCLELYRYFNRSTPKGRQIVKIKGGV